MSRWLWLIMIVASVLGGCASRKEPFHEWWASEKYEDYVPATAAAVASGTGVLMFRATEPGTIYVIDTSESVKIKETTVPHALGSSYVRKGGVVQFDPRSGELSANGQGGVKIEEVQPGHRFELRFDPVNKPEK